MDIKAREANKAKIHFHAYPVHDQDLCAKWTKANPRKDCAVCRRVIHCLPLLFIIVDRYALHCRRCKVMYSLRCGQTATLFGRRVERRQVSNSDDIYIVGQKQPASDFFFALVAIHKFTHEVRRIKVVVVLSSF